ncbi:hypothetical protein PC110_g17531 [Phytophthora cactorum]|nr:hypothetical protein PC110_g17531 [Phytophthora cactorum]
MQQTQLHELGASYFGAGVQTPGAYGGLGAGGQRGGAPFERQAAEPVPPPQYRAHRQVTLHIEEKMPSARDANIALRNFDGSGFEQRALIFIEQIEMAEQACGYRWPERFKPTLWFVVEQMQMSFRRTISTQQGMKLFAAKKDASRSWSEHFVYLLMMATNASPTLVLKNIVKYADPELRHTLMAKCDLTRPDSLQQANELAMWA